MDFIGSKNFSYLIVLFVVVIVLFLYVFVSNNIDDTIKTDIRGVMVEED